MLEAWKWEKKRWRNWEIARKLMWEKGKRAVIRRMGLNSVKVSLYKALLDMLYYVREDIVENREKEYNLMSGRGNVGSMKHSRISLINLRKMQNFCK